MIIDVLVCAPDGTQELIKREVPDNCVPAPKGEKPQDSAKETL